MSSAAASHDCHRGVAGGAAGAAMSVRTVAAAGGNSSIDSVISRSEGG
jgi:hypothetical protein